MAKDIQLVQISGYLFLLGVIISIIAGIVQGIIPSVGFILLVLGAIIGLLALGGWAKLTLDEERVFMLGTIALTVAGTSGSAFAAIPVIGSPYVVNIISNIGTLVVPAAVLIALHALWRVGAGKLRLGK